MSKNKLIHTVGLPRSGKSTWAKKQNLPIVNVDSIRLTVSGKRFSKDHEPEVWRLVPIIIKSLFLAGNPTVILDATNTTKVRRAAFKDALWQNCFVEFKTTKDICKQRALKTNQEDLLPIIEAMDNTREEITPDEGIILNKKLEIKKNKQQDLTII